MMTDRSGNSQEDLDRYSDLNNPNNDFDYDDWSNHHNPNYSEDEDWPFYLMG